MRKVLIGLLVLWAATYLASFIVPALSEATGDGFTRGLNRVTIFFGWQIAAGMMALIVWMLGRSEEVSTSMRWLSRLPGFLAAALLIFIVGVILWAALQKPPPTEYVPPGPHAPVTQPAAEPVKPIE